MDKLEAPRRLTFDCTGLERGMLTADDLRLLEEFGRARASLAHQEDRLDEAILIGRVSTDDSLAVLDIVEHISRLPIVDELACREERGSEYACQRYRTLSVRRILSSTATTPTAPRAEEERPWTTPRT